MLAEFDITVLYSQIVVRVSNVPPPTIEWTNDHTAQGFYWLPSIVAFGVPDPDGDCLIQVDTSTKVEAEPGALWAIRVPFKVPSVPLSIGAVHLTKDVKIPQGHYSLVFSALPGWEGDDGQDISYVLVLKFVLDQDPKYEILSPGEGVSTNIVLREGA